MRYKTEQINKWIDSYIQSGQSIKGFSDGKPFHSSTLSYWLGKRNKSVTSFIELKPDRIPLSTIEIRRPDGVIITISRDLSIMDIVQLSQC